MERVPDIDPNLDRFMDRMTLSVFCALGSAATILAAIRFNAPPIAPFSALGGMKSVEAWRASWVAWDEYQASKPARQNT